MAIDERARHQLYLRLEEHLGAEAATTLIGAPPADRLGGRRHQARPRPAASGHPIRHRPAASGHPIRHRPLRAATRSDIDQLQALTTADIERMGDQLRVEFYKALDEQTRTVVFADLGAVAAVGTLAFAPAQLV